ncbi:MAG: spore coat associated protein CotJA [Defluviitaleaceae bacterium]|nr:spore coat associated protein CotJA [Defluviitaleaceae bacterium]MCL2238553.1 spore coat associated protein CotJA [Defluviitaleaceae bacterium]
METVYTLHNLYGQPPKSTPQMPTAPTPEKMELAQAYVRHQPLEAVYSPEEGLQNGTIFPNLRQPYRGWQR